MTDTDATLAELRAVAEAAQQHELETVLVPSPWAWPHSKVSLEAAQRHMETFDPPTVIALITALERVRELHPLSRHSHDEGASWIECCQTCCDPEWGGPQTWPCPTIDAIDDALQGSTVRTGAGGQE